MRLALLHEDKSKEWLGVDFDGTMSVYDRFKGNNHVGPPIPKMINRIKRWLSDGENVKVFTARADSEVARKAIRIFCKKHIGKILPITNKKDKYMKRLYDDRAEKVAKNSGEIL